MFKSSIDNYLDEYKKTDYVYYNAMLTNDTSSPLEARLNEYRSEPIVINPKDYYLSVVRFNVPVSLIPIFVYPTIGNTTTPDNTQYSVTLIDSTGTPRRVFLTYTYLDIINQEPNIYTVQHFLDLINTAFAQAWAIMAGVVPSTPPYMVFNSVDKLFTLITEDAWTTGGPNNLKICMNSKLFLFFDYTMSFFNGYNRPNGDDFQIIVKNTGNNALAASQITPPNGTTTLNNGFSIRQEQASLDKWQAIRSIVFVSNTISVKPEYINFSSVQQNQNTGDSFRSILTDFEPPLTGGEILRGYLQYYPQGPYRLIDLTTDTNLKNLDFQLFWQDNRLKLHKIYINNAESVTIKIMFVRKSAYRNTIPQLKD